MKGLRPRRRSFRPIGAVRPGELGLSRARTRELALAHAWRTVVGEALAGRGIAVIEVSGSVTVAGIDPTSASTAVAETVLVWVSPASPDRVAVTSQEKEAPAAIIEDIRDTFRPLR